MPAHVYVLRSVSSGAFYVGSTCDLPRRLPEDRRHHSPYSRGRGPWEVVYREECADLNSARRRQGGAGWQHNQEKGSEIRPRRALVALRQEAVLARPNRSSVVPVRWGGPEAPRGFWIPALWQAQGKLLAGMTGGSHVAQMTPLPAHPLLTSNASVSGGSAVIPAVGAHGHAPLHRVPRLRLRQYAYKRRAPVKAK